MMLHNCTMFNTGLMYRVRKMCSFANDRFATRKEHKIISALSSGNYKQVFFQVSGKSNHFPQSYTCAATRSTALSTRVLQHATIPRPKALLRAADRTKLSLNTKIIFPGPLYLCARRSESHRRSSSSETTCCAQWRRVVLQSPWSAVNCRFGGSAYSAARLSLDGGPLSTERI